MLLRRFEGLKQSLKIQTNTAEPLYINTTKIHQNLALWPSRYSDEVVASPPKCLNGHQGQTFKKTCRAPTPCSDSMGVGRIFSRGRHKFFFREGQKWWNLIFPSRDSENNLFCFKCNRKMSNFKIQERPRSPLPTPMTYSLQNVVLWEKRTGFVLPVTDSS